MDHIYLLGQQSILRFYLLLLKWLSLDICQLQRKCTESFLETCREISVVSSPFVGQSPASMGSLSFFTVHANKFVSTKNSRNPRRVLLAILSLALSLFRSLPFTLPLFLSIRRIYLCECVWYMSVLSGGAWPARSRHLCGIEASFPRSGELWAGDLILLHVWIVPKDITTR